MGGKHTCEAVRDIGASVRAARLRSATPRQTIAIENPFSAPTSRIPFVDVVEDRAPGMVWRSCCSRTAAAAAAREQPPTERTALDAIIV